MSYNHIKSSQLSDPHKYQQQCIRVGHHPKGSDIGSSIFELLQVDQVQVLMITNAFEQGNWG